MKICELFESDESNDKFSPYKLRSDYKSLKTGAILPQRQELLTKDSKMKKSISR